MPRVIYFRLGDQDRPAFGTLLRTLKNVKGLLADFDAAVARDPRGNIRWEVAVLEKHSPLLLGVEGRTIARRAVPPVPDEFIDRVEAALLNSTAKLSDKAERADIVSDSALQRYKVLAQQTAKIGAISVYTETPHNYVSINEQTLANINKLTGTSSQSTGSVLGVLETISVHNDNEIRIWDENTRRPVRCWYPTEMEETIKSLLRERVLVSGVVSYNPFGQATKVKVSGLQRYPRVNELPSIEDVSGLVDDMTGGASLAEYLEHLRDD